MSSSFDITTQLATEATTLIGVVGAAIGSALTVWVIALGARVGISKFTSYVKKG